MSGYPSEVVNGKICGKICRKICFILGSTKVLSPANNDALGFFFNFLKTCIRGRDEGQDGLSFLGDPQYERRHLEAANKALDGVMKIIPSKTWILVAILITLSILFHSA